MTLHDRTVPLTRGALDHLVIASSGTWLIDAKRHPGEVQCRVSGAFGSGSARLYVNGRNQTASSRRSAGGWPRYGRNSRGGAQVTGVASTPAAPAPLPPVESQLDPIAPATPPDRADGNGVNASQESVAGV